METRIATVRDVIGPNQPAGRLVERLAEKMGGVQPALAVVLASRAQPLGEAAQALRGRYPNTTVLGASTAGEFNETGDSQGGTVLFALAGDFKVHAQSGRGLKQDYLGTVGRVCGKLPVQEAGYPHATGLVFIDPLAGNCEEAVLTTAVKLGAGVRLSGGAAADNMEMKSTLVVHNGEVMDDGLVVAMIYSKAPIGIGVSHGHTPLSEPLTVTRSSGSVVQEINGRPAWDVWVQATEQRCQQKGMDPRQLPEGEVFDRFLNIYEAGLDTGVAEPKIRVPLSRGKDGAISFACGIPTGTKLRVMESLEVNQIVSARRAVERSLKQLGGPAAGALVFDCSCRKSILKDRFREAVDAIWQGLDKAPFAGFETYGEVALEIGEMSGFHNTTTVVMTFPR